MPEGQFVEELYYFNLLSKKPCFLKVASIETYSMQIRLTIYPISPNILGEGRISIIIIVRCYCDGRNIMGDKQTLEVSIHKWLADQGYPLEMKVASLVRQSTNLNVRHGWHYRDSETNTSREIDIICTAQNPKGYAEINFVIECKGTSKPWILFSSEDTAAGFHRLSAFGVFSKEAFSEVAGNMFNCEDDTYKVAKSIPWLWKDGRIGYAITQAFEGKSDIPYAGVLSAVKAALWLESNSLWQNTKYRKFTVSFPVVVTSSPLYECYIDGAGEICLNPIASGFLFFQQHIGEHLCTCVSIVSEKGLDAFVTECQDVAERLMEVFSPAIEKEWDRFLKERNRDDT